MKFEYKQLVYGGKLEYANIELPPGTVLCHLSTLTPTQEMWVAMAPVSNYNKDYVPHYEGNHFHAMIHNLIEYDIIFFKNIVTTNWVKYYYPVTRQEFDDKFNKFFQSIYVYVYSNAKFKFVAESFINSIQDGILPELECIEEEKLITAIRLLSLNDLFCDRHFNVVHVDRRIPYGDHDDLHCMEFTTESNRILEKESVTDLHRVITHDSTLYDKLISDFNYMLNNLNSFNHDFQ